MKTTASATVLKINKARCSQHCAYTHKHIHTHHTHTQTHTHTPHTHFFPFLEFSNDYNLSVPSPPRFIHPRATIIYTRLEKPQYLGTAFPVYSCRSPCSRIASSDVQRPKIFRRFYKIKVASTDFHCLYLIPPYS
jgi:hypothetical protein